jgi:hypothetical protein
VLIRLLIREYVHTSAQNLEVILVSRSETTPLGEPYCSSMLSWNKAANSGADMSVVVGMNFAIFV